MKTYQEITESSAGTAGLLFIPDSGGHPARHDHAENIARAIKEPNTHVAVSTRSKIPFDEHNSVIQKIANIQGHRIFQSPSIYDAVDRVIAKTGTKHMIIHAEPSKLSGIMDGLKKTHNDKIKLSSLPLPNDIEDKTYTSAKAFKDDVHPLFHKEAASIYHTYVNPKLDDPAKKMREAYINNEIFNIGDIVKDNESGITGEILSRGTNYVTIVSEGYEHKCWLNSLETVNISAKRDQLYKESFIYKGYKTHNFTRSLAESFKELSKSANDSYALLNYIKALDYLLGCNIESITENFSIVRIQTERARKYCGKLGLTTFTESIVSVIEEDLLRYAVMEGIKYTSTDRAMIARVISNTAGIINNSMDPSNVINQAVAKLRNEQLTNPGWKLLGRLLNVATNAGIRWNKDTFPNSIQSIMELK